MQAGEELLRPLAAVPQDEVCHGVEGARVAQPRRPGEAQGGALVEVLNQGVVEPLLRVRPAEQSGRNISSVFERHVVLC